MSQGRPRDSGSFDVFLHNETGERPVEDPAPHLTPTQPGTPTGGRSLGQWTPIPAGEQGTRTGGRFLRGQWMLGGGSKHPQVSRDPADISSPREGPGLKVNSTLVMPGCSVTAGIRQKPGVAEPVRPGTRGGGGALFQRSVRVRGALPVHGALIKLAMHSLISGSGRRLRCPLTASSVPPPSPVAAPSIPPECPTGR